MLDNAKVLCVHVHKRIGNLTNLISVLSWNIWAESEHYYSLNHAPPNLVLGDHQL